MKSLGLTSPEKEERFAHLSSHDVEVLVTFAKRCSAAFWLEGTPHTVVKCFEHDIEIEGTPVRQAPYRLKGEGSKDLEKCIADDLARGQLIPGTGDEEWTSPGYVVRVPKLRMVVDYRKVNAKTRRSWFLIPRGDDQKAQVARAWLISLLDAVWGFNHIRNTKRARKVLAMISLSGVYLPVCLPFGP